MLRAQEIAKEEIMKILDLNVKMRHLMGLETSEMPEID